MGKEQGVKLKNLEEKFREQEPRLIEKAVESFEARIRESIGMIRLDALLQSKDMDKHVVGKGTVALEVDFLNESITTRYAYSGPKGVKSPERSTTVSFAERKPKK